MHFRLLISNNVCNIRFIAWIYLQMYVLYFSKFLWCQYMRMIRWTKLELATWTLKVLRSLLGSLDIEILHTKPLSKCFDQLNHKPTSLFGINLAYISESCLHNIIACLKMTKAVICLRQCTYAKNFQLVKWYWWIYVKL